MLLLNKEHTDTPIEQTKIKAQEIFEFKLNKQMETFFFSSPFNLAEEGKWLIAVISFEATNSVFNITDGNKTPTILTPGYWTPEGCEEPIN